MCFHNFNLVTQAHIKITTIQIAKIEKRLTNNAEDI
jgi:hypothetical protein